MKIDPIIQAACDRLFNMTSGTWAPFKIDYDDRYVKDSPDFQKWAHQMEAMIHMQLVYAREDWQRRRNQGQ